MYGYTKKSCTLLLLSASLLLPATASYAAPAVKLAAVVKDINQVKLSKAAALAIATKFAQPSKELTLVDTSFRGGDQWRPFPEWHFQWVKKGSQFSEYQSVGVSVHADTGEITSYHTSPGSGEQTDTRVTREEAQKIAEEFLAKNNPAKFKQVRLYTGDQPVPKTPLGKNISYNYRFARVVNDSVFAENFMDVTVNGSGKVINYYLTWNDQVQFEKPGKVITKEEATALLTKTSRFQLSYVLPWERRDNSTQVSLIYNNPFQHYIEASTGNKLVPSYAALRLPAPVQVSKTPLPLNHTGKQLSQNEAVQLAKKMFDLTGYNLQGANYRENDRNNYPVWDLSFTYGAKDKAPSRYSHVSINAQTGDILTFSKDLGISDTSNKPKLTTQQAQEIALKTVRKMLPSMADQLYLVEATPDGRHDPNYPQASFSFQRYINGIPAATGNGNLAVNTKTGEPVHFYFDFGSEKYTNGLPTHRTEKDAMEAWLGETSVELAYVVDAVPEGDQSLSDPNFAEKPKARLVYRATVTPSEQPYAYDALTGNWIKLSNAEPIQLHRPKPSDIAGHEAEKELLLMYEYDAISLIDGKILPEKEITRGEMIKMLVNSLYQGYGYMAQYDSSRANSFADVRHGSPYFAAVEAAIDRGLLDKSEQNLKPDELIKKEELAVLFVRALGLKKLSEYSDLFNTDVKDVSGSKQRGAIAIVTKLGIMKAENGAFAPQSTVTRADAAVAFDRFMKKKNELEDDNPRFIAY